MSNASSNDPYAKWFKLPPGCIAPNHYELLGLPLFEDDQNLIQQHTNERYALLDKYKLGTDAAVVQRLQGEVAAAFGCLSNLGLKSEYDQGLRLGVELPSEDISVLEQAAHEACTTEGKPPVQATSPYKSTPRPHGAHSSSRSHVAGLVIGGGVVLCGIAVVSLFLLTGKEEPPAVASHEPVVDEPDLSPPPALEPAPPQSAAQATEASGLGTQPQMPVVGTKEKVDTGQPIDPAPRENGGGVANEGASANVEEAKAGPPALPLEDLVDAVEPSVVIVAVEDGLGSGFVLDTLGSVVTNYHVIEGASTAEVQFRDGSRTKAQGIVAIDTSRDLAILHVDVPPEKLRPLTLAKDVRKGQRAFAFGAPKGLDFSVTEGIVSGIRSGDEINRILSSPGQSFYMPAMRLIQTTAAISPGNSGGPLIDAQGRLLGVNTSILFPSSSQSLNLAVSAEEIERIYNATSRRVQPFSVPTPPRTPGSQPPAVPRIPIAWTVSLPHDEVIHSGMFQLDVKQTWNAIYGQRVPVAVVQDDDYQLAAVCEPVSKRLDGQLTAIFPSGRPKFHASYKDGNREGPLMLWNQEGQLLYFENCRNDKVYDLCCLFKNGVPWLIEDYSRYTRTAIYRIADFNVAETFQEDRLEEKWVAQGLSELAEIREQIAQSEVEFKRKVRDYVDDVRRQVASRRSVASRESILATMQARDAANRAAMSSYSAKMRRAGL